MKQIAQNIRTGETRVLDVPHPQIGKMEVLVATKSSLISAGTEKMLIDFANKSLLGKAQERPDLAKQVINKISRDGLSATLQSVFSKLEEPLPLGYSAAGDIIAVGDGVKDCFKVGEKVAVAGAGVANHAEINAVPKNLVSKIPENVSYEEASFTTLISIAMQGFRNSKAVLGDNVLVIGLGLVGQLTTQLAAAAGCHVFAVDFNEQRLKIAEENGAEKVHLLSAGNAEGLVAEFTNGKGFDSVIICAATDRNDPVEMAASWARDKARIVLTGKTGTTLPYADYMKKEVEFVVSRSYGPGRYDPSYEQKGQDYPIGFVRWTEQRNMQEALNLISSGALNVKALISHKFEMEKVNDAYKIILNGEPCLGIILNYSRELNERISPRVPIRPSEVATGNVGVALIGAGGYARAILLPALKKLEKVSFTGILTKGGLSAKVTGDQYGFSFAATEPHEIFTSNNTKAVIIATRHDTHASLAIGALKSGKHVFVEKPLAMNEEELLEVKEVFETSGKTLTVGFNRRFSPYTQAIMDAFSSMKDVSRQIIIRVNAGKLPSDNWQNDTSIGGGRLIGELCHFLDLALYLSGGKELDEVRAVQGEGQDVYNVTMSFKDGTFVTIVYTSEGDSAFSKERIEVYGGGMVGVIDNFTSATIVNSGKISKVKIKEGIFNLKTQDKGQKNQLISFIMAVKGKGKAPISPDELFLSSRLPFIVQESIKTGLPVKV